MTDKLRRPRISLRVIEGIIDATSFVEAGGGIDGLDDYGNENIRKADQWARKMRTYLESKPNGGADEN